MKILKWVVAALIAIAVVVVVVNANRDAIGRDLINRILDGSNFSVAELSVSAVSATHIDLARIVIARTGGDRYRLADVSLDLDLGQLWPTRVAARVLEVEFGEPRAEPAPLVPAVRDLPGTVLGLRPVELQIGLLEIPGLPSLRNARAKLQAGSLDLALEAAALPVRGRLTSASGDAHRLVVSVSTPDDAAGGSIELTVDTSAGGLGVSGDFDVPARLLTAILPDAGKLPVDFGRLDTDLAGQFRVAVDEPGPGDAAISGELAIPGGLSVPLVLADDTVTVAFADATRARFTFGYPGFGWTVAADAIGADVSVPGLPVVALDLRGLSCEPAIHCRADGSFRVGPLEQSTMSLAKLEGQASLAVTLDENLRIVAGAGGRFDGTDLLTDAADVRSLTVDLSSDLAVTIGDDGWSASLQRFGWSLDRLTTEVPSLATLATSLQGAGTMRGTQENVDAEFDILRAAGRPAAGSVAAHYVDADDRLALSIAGIKLDFGDRPLSAWFGDWQHSWDLVSGSLLVDAQIDADFADDGMSYSGRSSERFRDVAGRYEDIGFVGLAADVDTVLDSLAGHVVKPFAMTMALMDVGVQLDDIAADISPDLAGGTIAVSRLDMKAFGGRVSTEPFVYSPGAAANAVTLIVDSLQLSFIVGLLELDDLQSSGVISGRIPVTFSDGKVTVSAGHLESDATGGSIRLNRDDVDLDAEAGNSGMQTVMRSLRNFQFETLASEVSYTEAGDLKLQVRMKGINPDVDPTQPIILNLGVENNIPELLRSLLAVRSIEDILERETQN